MKRVLCFLMVFFCGCTDVEPPEGWSPQVGEDVAGSPPDASTGHDLTDITCGYEPGLVGLNSDPIQNKYTEQFCAGDVYVERVYDLEREEFDYTTVDDNCCGRDVFDSAVDFVRVVSLSYEHKNPDGPQLPDGTSINDTCLFDLTAHRGEKPGFDSCADCENVVSWKVQVEFSVTNIGKTTDGISCMIAIPFPSGVRAEEYGVDDESVYFDAVPPGESRGKTVELESRYWGCAMLVWANCKGLNEPWSLTNRSLDFSTEFPNIGQTVAIPPI